MKLLNTILITILFLASVACSSESHFNPHTPGTDTIKEKTVIFYLVGDEFRIYDDLANNLRTICDNLDATVDSKKVNIIAYIDILYDYQTIPSEPRVYEVKYDPKTNKGDTLSVIFHNERNSLEYKNVKDFFSMVMSKYPANNYSLIWGSHGSGWFPGPDIKEGKRALGPDGASYIQFDEFVEAIPAGMKFDYIIFDACFMAQTEIVMQLKNKVDYIIAAPSEMPIKGFPYNQINLMCNATTEEQYIQLCEAYHHFYTETEPTGHTISLIKTSGIDKIADSFKQIIEASSDEALELLPIDRVQNFDGQQFCFDYVTTCFDLEDLATTLLAINYDEDIPNKEELLETLRSDIKWAIKYEAHSNALDFGTYVKINKCCGITTYWPNYKVPYANNYYYNYDWCEASGMDYILNYLDI